MENKYLIEKLISNGDGLSRTNEKITFIEGAIPGETVSIKNITEKKRFNIATVDNIITSSQYRIEKECIYKECGGCNLNHIDYDFQLECKKVILEDSIKDLSEIKEVISSTPNSYRNRTRMLHQSGKVGYRAKSSHNFIPVEKCIICSDVINNKIAEINSRTTTISADEIQLQETLDGKCEISNIGQYGAEKMPAFSQINSEINNLILEKIDSEIEEGSKVLDLFCGNGNLSGHLNCEVLGIDISEDAIEFATKRYINKKYRKNNINNFLKHMDKNAEYDVLILDPPRAGLKKMVEQISKIKAKKIIYISCSPPDLKRDLQAFKNLGIEAKETIMYDMFPQTNHIESLTIL